MTTDFIPFTLTNESITVLLHGRAHTVHRGTPQYVGLRAALFAERYEEVERYLSLAGALAAWLRGTQFRATDEGQIYYGQEQVPQSVCERLASIAVEGGDPSPLLRFYERLDRNPSMRSRQQLHAFLAHRDIAIEPDGTLLAYKGLRQDYLDVHSGTFDNRPGQVHEMPRRQISDDPSDACAAGFHVGALEYAQNFGIDGTVVICRVDPEHVVSVPLDSSAQKMRVCKYEVVGLWDGQGALPSVYDARVDLDDDEDEDGPWFDDDEDEDGPPLNDDQEAEATAKPAPVQVQVTKTVDRWEAMRAMTPADLMDCSIDSLRKFAGALQIVGASKMPGGKSALVAAIVRRRRRKSK